MVTHLSRTQIESMTPQQIAEAVRANTSKQQASVDTNPRNLQDVIRKTDPFGNGFQMPAEAQVLQEAGMWPIYHLQTGIMSLVLKNLLPAKLSERNEYGQLVYTVDKSEAPEPVRPAYPCMLNEQHPMWPEAQKLGYRAHNKFLKTPHDVLVHMRNRHEAAWQAFERMKDDTEKSEDREWRKASMAAITSVATAAQANPSTVEKACIGCGESVMASSNDAAMVKLEVHERDCEHFQRYYGDARKKAQIQEVIQTLPKPAFSNKECPHCEFIATAKNMIGAASKLRAHIRREHPDAD